MNAFVVGDLATSINTALSGLDKELLLIVPAALTVTLVTWGTPKAVKFFKRLAG